MSGCVIHTHWAGPMGNMQYVIQSGTEALVVDPAWDIPELQAIVTQQGLTVVGILLTHEHYDHVSGVPECLALNKVPVYISEYAHYDPPVPMVLNRLAVGATIPFAGHSIAVLHTPGHSPGGVCYRLGKQLITGDTVFVDGCGRADLPHSDVAQLYTALFETLWPLPDDTVIYPGHDYGPTPTDTWGNQKQTNRFLQSETRDIFLRKRKG